MMHGAVQSLACLFAIVGYYSMYHQHSTVAPASQLGLDPGNTTVRIAHVWLGYTVLAGMLIQGCQGWLKFANLTRYRLHPKSGLVLVVLAGVNVSIILTPLLAFGVSDATYWTVQGSVLCASVLAALVASSSGKAAARELPDPVTTDIEDMYKFLPSGATVETPGPSIQKA